MNIELKEISVGELVEDYKDDGEGGVTGYGGKLDIRPPYQREFVYKDRQREEVIHTLVRGFPLNVMYWAVREDGDYEIIDGQQRTISIAQYVRGDFSFRNRYFHNLQEDEKTPILDYTLMVYLCTGTDSEKLDWFKTVNIAGEELTDQELRNAVYHGSWVTAAKKHFSRTKGPAYEAGRDYLKGSAIRQDYLETVIKWASNGEIEDYMARHQHDDSAEALWKYFLDVMGWVKEVFPKVRKEMKGVDWGGLHRLYGDQSYDPGHIEDEVSRLMADDDVTKKAGIYSYVLGGDEKHLNIRGFTTSMKRSIFEQQGGICPICKEGFELSKMEADHITPWVEGGKTYKDNCQVLCKPCNRRKSSK